MKDNLSLFLYYDLTWLILIPALIFGLIAQAMVKGRYNKYSRELSQCNMTGAEAARHILDNNGLSGVRISRTSGTLTDHYDPSNDTVFLSDGVYDGRSIAAIGIAAHESGHAIQHSESYGPVAVRNAIVPVTKIGNMLSTPLIFIGIIIGFTPLITAGIVLFGTILVFQLVTLPVEFNASKRALISLENYSILLPDENEKVKKVLTAAALTYVAAVVSSIATILRLLLLSRRRR